MSRAYVQKPTRPFSERSYVLYIKSRTVERYLTNLDNGRITHSVFLEDAKTFPSARDAYYWAGDARLDDWRVGLR